MYQHAARWTCSAIPSASAAQSSQATTNAARSVESRGLRHAAARPRPTIDWQARRCRRAPAPRRTARLPRPAATVPNPAVGSVRSSGRHPLKASPAIARHRDRRPVCAATARSRRPCARADDGGGAKPVRGLDRGVWCSGEAAKHLPLHRCAVLVRARPADVPDRRPPACTASATLVLPAGGRDRPPRST